MYVTILSHEWEHVLSYETCVIINKTLVVTNVIHTHSTVNLQINLLGGRKFDKFMQNYKYVAVDICAHWRIKFGK